MKSLEDKQKMFCADLFEVGDELNANIVSVDANGAKLITAGNCQGVLEGDLPPILTTGTTIEVRVIAIDAKDGKLYFDLTENFVLEKLPQEATVSLFSNRAIVVELVNFSDTYGIYYRKENDGLQLKYGDRVIVSKLQKGEERFLVGNLEILPPEEPKVASPKKAENPLAPWTPDKVEAVRAEGSRKKHGKYELGKVYPVLPYVRGSKEVLFENDKDNKTGEMNIRFPEKFQRAFARVIFIDEDKRIKLEFVRGEEKPKDEGINQTLREEALKNGSKERAGGYFLGRRCYELKVVNGKPFIGKSKAFGVPALDIESAEVIVNPGHPEYQEGDLVQFEVAFIKRIGVTKNYQITVNVLSVNLSARR